MWSMSKLLERLDVLWLVVGQFWIVEDRRESDCRLQRIWACCSEAYACFIRHWSHSHARCSVPGSIHMQAALLTGRVPVGRLISVEDCCLISVGAEGVSWVLHYRDSVLVELYSIQLLLINPRIVVCNKKKIVHTSCVLCVHCGDDLMIYCWYMLLIYSYI